MDLLTSQRALEHPSTDMLDDFPYILTVLNSFSQAHMLQGHYAYVESLNHKLKDLYTEKFGPRVGVTTSAYIFLGFALQYQDRNQEAMAVFAEAAENADGLRPPYDWMSIQCRGELAWCKSEAGQSMEAEEMFRQVMASIKLRQVEDLPAPLVRVGYRFAHSLMKWEKPEEGLQVMKDNVNHYADTFGEEDTHTLDAATFLKATLEDCNRWDDVAEVDQRFGKYWESIRSGSIKS